MPKRTVIIFTCSLCAKEFKPEDMESFTLAWSAGPKLNYDVCINCIASDPWRPLFEAGEDKHGAPVGKQLASKNGSAPYAKAADTFDCEVCARPFTTPQGKGAHKLRAHGIAGTSKTPKVNA